MPIIYLSRELLLHAVLWCVDRHLMLKEITRALLHTYIVLYICNVVIGSKFLSSAWLYSAELTVYWSRPSSVRRLLYVLNVFSPETVAHIHAKHGKLSSLGLFHFSKFPQLLNIFLTDECMGTLQAATNSQRKCSHQNIRKLIYE